MELLWGLRVTVNFTSFLWEMTCPPFSAHTHFLFHDNTNPLLTHSVTHIFVMAQTWLWRKDELTWVGCHGVNESSCGYHIGCLWVCSLAGWDIIIVLWGVLLPHRPWGPTEPKAWLFCAVSLALLCPRRKRGWRRKTDRQREIKRERDAGYLFNPGLITPLWPLIAPLYTEINTWKYCCCS